MKMAIIGGGPAGFMAAITAKQNNPDWDVTIFDRAKPLASLLYTGGGRCNITNAKFDFKDLVQNYPRGEKFLYSVFSRFDVGSLFEFFAQHGLELYIQDDERVFPASDMASDVRDVLISAAKNLGVRISSLTPVKSLRKEDDFILNENSHFDRVVVATGGKNNVGFSVAKNFGHTVTELAPVLCGLKARGDFSDLAGVVAPNVTLMSNEIEVKGDLLFTHSGVSGPAVFDFSSYAAFAKFPLAAKINFSGLDFDSQDKLLIELLAQNPKKEVHNLLTEYVPHGLSQYLLKKIGISQQKKSFEINSDERKKIAQSLSSFELEFVSRERSYMVTAGGVSLDEVDKNLQSKLVDGLYFCGEILNIDGLCGGYNLQACFSTGYVVGSSIN